MDGFNFQGTARYLLSQYLTTAEGELLTYRIDAEHPQDRLFLVAAVTTRVDADGGELASLAPAFDGQSRDAQELSHLGNRE